MENNNLVNLSLAYYDERKKKYKKYYNPQFTLEGVIIENTKQYYLNNNNINIFKCEVHFIGRFYKDNNIFRWGWAYLDDKNKNLDIFKQIINYLFYKDNIIRKLFLRFRMTIKYPLELELILAITLYITKSDMIYKETNKDNITYYYLLKNIEML
jgi:hypothetical protein